MPADAPMTHWTPEQADEFMNRLHQIASEHNGLLWSVWASLIDTPRDERPAKLDALCVALRNFGTACGAMLEAMGEPPDEE